MRAVEIDCDNCNAPPGVMCPARGRALYCKVRVDAARKQAPPKEKTKVDRGPVPGLQIQVYLVGHGYQLDVFSDGKYITGGCRDFSDTHKIEDLKASFMEGFGKMLEQWRKKL